MSACFYKADLQKENLLRLLKNGAFRFIDDQTPWFPYTSGQIGPYYVQSIAVESDGQAYAGAVADLARLIADWGVQFEVISGGETRDWDFSNPCAVLLRKPHLKLYKDGRVLGADVRGKRVLHVVDLNNEGSSVRDYWLPLVRRCGGEMVGVAAYVDRLEEGVEVMRQLALPLAAVVPLDDCAWQIAGASGAIASEIQAELIARRRDPLGWALARLEKHPEPLRVLFSDSEKRAKALKIIGYYKKFNPELERFCREN